MKCISKIKQIKGVVNNKSKFNTGHSIGISKMGVQFIVTAPNRNDVAFIVSRLMGDGFVINEKEVKETALCLLKKVDLQ